MKTLKEYLLLPINFIRAIVGLIKNADEYSKQKDWEDHGWQEAERKRSESRKG